MLSASEQHARTVAQSATAVSSEGDAPGWVTRLNASGSSSLSSQRKALHSAGLRTEAELAERHLATTAAESLKRRDELEQSLYKQRLWGLELQQKQERTRLETTHVEARMKAEAALREEEEALAETHAQETAALIELVTRAAALEEVDAKLPRQLFKQRFRPSEQLVSLRHALERLECSSEYQSGQSQALRDTADKIRRKLRELEAVEVSTWRKVFLQTALGPEPTSCMNRKAAWPQTSAKQFASGPCVLSPLHVAASSSPRGRDASSRSFPRPPRSQRCSQLRSSCMRRPSPAIGSSGTSSTRRRSRG